MVRLRLSRHGSKKRPYYKIVAIDSRKPRDTAPLEFIGYYHPVSVLSQVKINKERALYWLKRGAKPSKTVEDLLRKSGIWKEDQAKAAMSEGETQA